MLSANNAAAGFDEAVLVDEGILMEGFGPPPGATYCMFPDEQELLVQEWDQYGAVMDTSALRVEEGECASGFRMCSHVLWSVYCVFEGGSIACRASRRHVVCDGVCVCVLEVSSGLPLYPAAVPPASSRGLGLCISRSSQSRRSTVLRSPWTRHSLHCVAGCFCTGHVMLCL